MTEDAIGYERLMQEAMRGVVRAALQQAAGPHGLPGKHHFYVTFRTPAPGVVLPAHLLERYPEEMTIVLEHQFWDLDVYPDRFRVILKFNGEPHPIVIPFPAVIRFYDPAVKFGLQLEPYTDESSVTTGEPAPALSAPAESPQPAAAIVSLDAFRKK